MSLETENNLERTRVIEHPSVMIWNNGKFLLVAQEETKYVSTPWMFPRGRTKYGEYQAQDLLSLSKDFGIKIKVRGKICRKKVENYQKPEFLGTAYHVVYRADYLEGKFLGYDDFIRHRWVTLSEARELDDLHPIVKKAIETIGKVEGHDD